VNLAEGLRIALWSLVANPLRSFLTLLGIIIGVTSIIAVVAVINGLDLYVSEKLVTLGPTSFEVNRFGIITNRKQFLEAVRRNPELRISDADLVRTHAALAEDVGVKMSRSIDLKHGNRTVLGVSLRGVTPEIFRIEPYEVASGRALNSDDDSRALAVAFLGSDVATELFCALDPIRRSVKIRGRSFQVVGVGTPQGSVFGQSRDNYVIIPLGTYRKQYGQHESVSIVVRTREAEDVEQAMDQVRVVLRARHHLRPLEPDDFGFVSAEAINSLWRDLSRTIFQIAIFVVGISLVVGGIVIMNIMLVSVIERTREIGLRKAIGARERDIRRQFLIESVVLAAAGGLVGLILAYLTTWAIRSFSPLPAEYPWWAPALALGISSAVGIFFGILPARKASRLNPIEALRCE
jgi:putative ABC transport system permease protein